MNEVILSRIWSKLQFNVLSLTTEEGAKIEILFPGKININSGPDFQNAKIKIDGVLWFGTVELHVRSSDWKKHQHQKNLAYENVILHVIWENDLDITYQNGERIPQLVLSKFTTLESISFKEVFQFIPCENILGNIDKKFIYAYLNEIIFERLENKSQDLYEIYEENLHDLEGTFYQALGRVFGLPLNTQPMELLLKMIPLKMVLNYRNNTLKLESLFFGLAGFLEEEALDEYSKILKKEFFHIKNKYQIKGEYLKKFEWKFSKTRPSNFPGPRIAQFIQFITEKISIVSFILSIENHLALKKILKFDLEGYWKEHYDFGKKNSKVQKKSSDYLRDLIYINAVIPLLFFYGRLKNQAQYSERAINNLRQLKSENNFIIRGFKNLAIEPKSALDSQALYYLKKNYCDKKKCWSCKIGEFYFNKSD